jgi:site-specific recombinase XerD
MLEPEKNQLIVKFKEILEIKRYSNSSVNTYCSVVKNFLSALNIKKITNIDSLVIQKFLTKRVTKDKISFSTQK